MNQPILHNSVVDPEAWDADSIFAALEQFDSILRASCGVHLVDGQSSEIAVGHLLDLLSAFKQETEETPTRDGRDGWRIGLGLWDMATKTNAISGHSDFRQLCPHFQLFLEETRLVQNMKALATDSVSHKLFELVIALSVLQFGTQVELDHPVHSSGGTNPDILAQVHGIRWAFACKVLSGQSILSYKDLVASGVAQIQRSNAQRGVVVVSLSNRIDHDALFPPFTRADGTVRYGCHDSAEAFGAAVEAQVEALLAGWEEAFGGADGLQEVFGGMRASPIVLNYVNVTGLVMRNKRPVLTAIRHIVPLALVISDNAETDAIVELLDTAVQRPFVVD